MKIRKGKKEGEAMLRANNPGRTTWRRAAITVEASFLVPWMVMLLALLITMTFAIHNRTWYHTAALESALAGNQYIPGSGGNGRAGRSPFSGESDPAGTEKAKETLLRRIRDQAMPGSVPETQAISTGDRTSISVSGQQLPAFRQWFTWDVDTSVKKIRPAPVVRGAWIVKEVWQTWMEAE